TGNVTATSNVATTGNVTATSDVTATGNVTATSRRGRVATTSSSGIATARGCGRVATTGNVTATSNVATTGNVTATSDVTATGNVTATSDVATTGNVATAGGVAATVEAEAGVELDTALVGLGLHAETGDVNADTDGLRRTGSGERGARGDYRTCGYPRDADSRLLGHLLLPPVAVLNMEQPYAGPRPCGVALSAGPHRAVAIPPAPVRTPVPDIRMLLEHPVQS
ncbi:hypothetical protein ACTU45_16570, partial [Streptomyces sp. 24-1644]|uniref:hypothetical protein n=1 Tax=Streptomyces sp. 24-1644 TaxID=3457315 RepID=UPI003FA6FE85